MRRKRRGEREERRGEERRERGEEKRGDERRGEERRGGEERGEERRGEETMTQWGDRGLSASSRSGGTYVIPAAAQISRPQDQKDDKKLTVCGSWEAGDIGVFGSGFGPNPSFGCREMIMESRDVQEEFPKNDSEPDSLREDWAAWTRVLLVQVLEDVSPLLLDLNQVQLLTETQLWIT
ncbi:hypothetical protein D4764_13G0009750 [Takifugu flavidus]|uniref:Uncharacterized protein n=1 Tax=Takifugu flavidus TaxID=433684 RepID=A0A5C6PA00_9TELE|nr:hypothetical protein D4764_13G0009750 [Takifugu flavidus]